MSPGEPTQREEETMDFSYALGYESRWEQWMFPYTISLLLTVAMLWFGLLGSDHALTRWICYESNKVVRFFGVAGALIGLLCFASAPFGGHVIPWIAAGLIRNSGGPLSAAILAAAALIFGWITMTCTLFDPHRYRQMKEVK